jgi:hypothetical protein
VATSARLTEIVAQGSWGAVEAVILESGTIPALEFLNEELEDVREGKKGDEQSSAKARFMVLFQQMANYGQLSPKRFKTEMEGLCAFRHEVKNVQIRFPCFRDGNRWILTHGFIKPGAKGGLGKWPKTEIERAKAIRDDYFRRKLKLGVLPNRGEQS